MGSLAIVTLISRTISDSPLKWNEKQKVSLIFPVFTLDDTRQYMALRGLELTEHQLRQVFQLSKTGHPLLVSLAGDNLGRLDRNNSENIDFVLERLVERPATIPGSIKKPIVSLFGPRIRMEELTTSIDRIITALREDIRKGIPSRNYY